MRVTAIALVTAFTLLASASATMAQECRESMGEGTGSSRDTAMRIAFGSALRAIDERVWATWNASGQRVGEAPGYAVRKLTSNCSAGGAGQICRISVTLCRN